MTMEKDSVLLDLSINGCHTCLIMLSLKQLIIADLNLVSYEGHNYEYSLSLEAEARRRGIHCHIWGNVRMDPNVAKKIDAIPVFHLTYGEPLPIPGFLKSLSGICYFFRFFGLYKLFRALEYRATFRGHDQALHEDLQRIEKTAVLDSRTFVLFHTIQPPQIEPICRWWKSFPLDCRPHLGLLFRFEPECEPDHPVRAPRWTRRAYALLSNSYDEGKLHLLTDSTTLAREYEARIERPFSVIPIPQSSPRDALTPSTLTQPVKIGYLGNARDNKGFPQLPKLIMECRDWISEKKVEFLIQLCASVNPEAASQIAFLALQHLPITPIMGPLGSDGYYNLLGQLDVVLLPYDLQYYKSQTSGIFSDALTYGKIVIVPNHTWMSDQLTSYGSGVIYDSEEANGLLAAVRELLDRYPEIKRRASQAVIPWISAHSASRYIEQIQSLSSRDLL